MVAASVNFPVWRGRVRHSFKYPMLARFARRTGFMDAAYGPSQFYFGELFATDRTGAPHEPRRGRSQRRQRRGRGALARGARRLRLPALLPARDRLGRAPGGDALRPAAVAGADDAVATLMSAAGGVGAVPRALRRRAVRRPRPVRRSTATTTSATRSPTCACSAARARTDPSALRSRRRRLEPRGARLPARRAGYRSTRSRERLLAAALGRRRRLARGRARRRPPRGPRAAVRAGRAAARRAAAALDGRGRPRDARARRATARCVSATYPNALERLWQILGCVNAGDVVASAAPGYEFRDAGGASHLGGGSHGSLHAVDSLVPLRCGRRAGRPRAARASARSRTSQRSVRGISESGPGDPAFSADVLEWPLPHDPVDARSRLPDHDARAASRADAVDGAPPPRAVVAAHPVRPRRVERLRRQLRRVRGVPARSSGCTTSRRRSSPSASRWPTTSC